MAKKKETAEAPAFNVEARDGYNNGRVFFDKATKQQFTKPDSIFKVQPVTKSEANEICELANTYALLKGWGITFEVVPFTEYEADPNGSPFLTW